MQNTHNTSSEEELLKLLEGEPEYQIISQKFKETNNLRIQFIRDQIIKNLQTDLEKIRGNKIYQRACQDLAIYTDELFIIQGTDKNYYVSAFMNNQNDNRIQELDKYDLRKIYAQDFLDPQLNSVFTQNIEAFLADINRFDMKKIQSEIDSIIKSQTKTIQQSFNKRILYEVNGNQQLIKLDDYISKQMQELQQFLVTISKYEKNFIRVDNMIDPIHDLRGNSKIIQQVHNSKLLQDLMNDLGRLTHYMKQQQDLINQRKQIKQIQANNTSYQQQEQIPQPSFNQPMIQNNNKMGQIKIISKQSQQQQQEQQQQQQQQQKQAIFDYRERSPIKNKTIDEKNLAQRNYLQNQGDRNQKK